MAQPRCPTQALVRRLALALPGVIESSHQGTPDFRVNGKIFATLPPKHPGRVVLKVEPAELDFRARQDSAIYQDVWGGRWMGVELALITRAQLGELLQAAWELAARPRAKSPAGSRGGAATRKRPR
jgi:hypothetical protein